ncbi:MAG: DsbA family protein [Gammaproteobacteria bacterium]|nr:DsbA family protein [Gammaproteobacteria bacterium]
MKPRLFYIHDPMCSWCWGFKAAWDQVQEQVADEVDVVYVAGGLAPENHDPMPEAMRHSLEQTWHNVSEKTGAQFNFDFWRNNTPNRSTYPACKAVLVAREFDKELQMIERIQQFYYQQAGNPSVYSNLYDLAEDIGIERRSFINRLHSAEIAQLLQNEIMKGEALGAQGFPSLVLSDSYGYLFIQHHYTDVEHTLNLIREGIERLKLNRANAEG